MTKKPSRLEKAADRYTEREHGVGMSEDLGFQNDFRAGARWAYRALLREMKKDHMDCSSEELRYLWRRISKAGK